MKKTSGTAVEQRRHSTSYMHYNIHISQGIENVKDGSKSSQK